MALEPDAEIDHLILQIQDAFNSKNIESFLGFFHANIRDVEKTKIISKIEDFQMERIAIYKVLLRLIDENQINLHLRVKYDNVFSVIIELWRLRLVKIDGDWLINFVQSLNISGHLFKIDQPVSVYLDKPQSPKLYNDRKKHCHI